MKANDMCESCRPAHSIPGSYGIAAVLWLHAVQIPSLFSTHALQRLGCATWLGSDCTLIVIVL